jgi:hypothetical protein
MLASNAVNHAVDAMAGQTITYAIGICCFSAKQADCLAWNPENKSEWSCKIEMGRKT